MAIIDINETEASVFEYGNVFIEFHPLLMEKWAQNGERYGVTRTGEIQIQINRSGATIEGILLNPKEVYACTIICKENEQPKYIF